MSQKSGIKIYVSGLRHNLAQLCLRLIYGRKKHYISPWKLSGIVGNVVIIYKGKVLLGRRRGNIERTGKIGLFGGHIDPLYKETMEEGVVREVFEETSIKIDESKLTNDNLVYQTYIHNINYIEMQNGSTFVFYFKYDLSETELDDLQESEEAHDFNFYSLSEVEDLATQNEISSNSETKAIRNAFAKINAN